FGPLAPAAAFAACAAATFPATFTGRCAFFTTAAPPASPPAVANRNTAARRQAQLPLRDHSFSSFEAGFDHHVLIDAGAHRYRPRIHGPIGFDHVNKSPVLSGLHGLVRDRDRVLAGGEPQGHANELSGPELVAGVRKRALEFDGAGSHVH